MIKILSYVSKINKNQKQMKKVLEESMKSIKFSYEEKKVILNMKNFILIIIIMIKMMIMIII